MLSTCKLPLGALPMKITVHSHLNSAVYHGCKATNPTNKKRNGELNHKCLKFHKILV